jgi:DnaK suppressor protein
VRNNSHLSDSQIEEIQRLILDEQIRIKNKQASSVINNSESDMKDSVDEANTNIQLESMNRINNRETLYLKKLFKTSKKIESGEYGICTDCEAEIPFTRLKARIVSDLCIDCKEESESEENKSYAGRQSKSLGQKIDIVKSI